ISERALACTQRLPKAPLHAFVDNAAFQKIISNLLDNAIKYTSRHILVTLEDRGPDGRFVVRIANDGPQITASDREKIFEPFYRRRRTENKSGTGLGLPLARSLARLHNGTLSCTLSPQGWNEFILVIPVHQDQEFDIVSTTKHRALPPPPAPVKEIHSAPTILIVEDHPDILRLLATTFSSHMQVQTATNGRDALAIARQTEISLIISDVMMPIMDGFELCRTVKSDIRFSHIPMMLLTAKT